MHGMLPAPEGIGRQRHQSADQLELSRAEVSLSRCHPMVVCQRYLTNVEVDGRRNRACLG